MLDFLTISDFNAIALKPSILQSISWPSLAPVMSKANILRAYLFQDASAFIMEVFTTTTVSPSATVAVSIANDTRPAAAFSVSRCPFIAT